MARFTEYKRKLRPYLQAMPDIFRYVIVTKGILFAMMFLFGGMAKALLSSVGRVAVTSGDWKFLYTTWQGMRKASKDISSAVKLTESSQTTSGKR